jgi:hypothetical protein
MDTQNSNSAIKRALAPNLTDREEWEAAVKAKLTSTCFFCQVEAALDYWGANGPPPHGVRPVDIHELCDRHDLWSYAVVEEALVTDSDLKWFSEPPYPKSIGDGEGTWESAMAERTGLEATPDVPNDSSPTLNYPRWVDLWKLVELADWPARQYGTAEDGKMLLMARLTAGEVEEFEVLLRDEATTLRDAVVELAENTRQSLCIGDDDLDDLVYHIIGLGRAEYDRALSDPQRVIDRGESRDYTEGFSRAMPRPEDVENADPNTYRERALNLVVQYQMLYRRPELRCFVPWLRETIRLLEALAQGDCETFVRNLDRGRRIAGDLTDGIDDLVRCIRRKGIPYDAPTVPEAELRRLYRDARRWLVEYPEERARAAADVGGP